MTFYGLKCPYVRIIEVWPQYNSTDFYFQVNLTILFGQKLFKLESYLFLKSQRTTNWTRCRSSRATPGPLDAARTRATPSRYSGTAESKASRSECCRPRPKWSAWCAGCCPGCSSHSSTWSAPRHSWELSRSLRSCQPSICRCERYLNTEWIWRTRSQKWIPWAKCQ